MGASGCDRKVPEVWGQSLRSSDAHARKAAEIPDEPNIEDGSLNHYDKEVRGLHWLKTWESLSGALIFVISQVQGKYKNGIDKESTPVMSNRTVSVRKDRVEV